MRDRLVTGLVNSMRLGLEYTQSSKESLPFGSQVTLEPEDVDSAYEKAILAGARGVAAPKTMPWQWRAAFVRDIDGFLIELAKEV